MKYLQETQKVKVLCLSGSIILKTRKKKTPFTLLYSLSHLVYLTQGPKIWDKLIIDWIYEAKINLSFFEVVFVGTYHNDKNLIKIVTSLMYKITSKYESI